MKIYASQAHVAEKINESSEALLQKINETSESLSSEIEQTRSALSEEINIANNGLQQIREDGGVGYSTVSRTPIIESLVLNRADYAELPAEGTVGYMHDENQYFDSIYTFVDGDKCTISIDGSEYILPLRGIGTELHDIYYDFGNIWLVNHSSPNTGEEIYVQYLVRSDRAESAVGLVSMVNYGDSITVSFYAGDEQIHKIEPKYLPKNGFGYTASNVYTYNGDLDGKVTTEISNFTAVRVGDVIDPKTIKKIGGLLGGQMTVVSSEDLSFVSTSVGFGVIANGMQLVTVVTADIVEIPTGTYVTHADIGYVTNVWCEDVNPIDSKYIPSSTPSVQSTSSGEIVAVDTVDENGTPLSWKTIDISQKLEDINKLSSDFKNSVNSRALGSVCVNESIIYEGTDLQPASSDGDYSLYVLEDVALLEDHTCTVKYMDNTYILPVKQFTTTGTTINPYIGNLSLLYAMMGDNTIESTGEPFVIIGSNSDSTIMVTLESSITSLSIADVFETTNHIDPKFIIPDISNPNDIVVVKETNNGVPTELSTVNQHNMYRELAEYYSNGYIIPKSEPYIVLSNLHFSQFDGEIYSEIIESVNFKIEDEKEYKIIWDGVEYNSLSGIDGSTEEPYIGIGSPSGETSTYLYLSTPSDGTLLIKTHSNFWGQHSLILYGPNDRIVPFDERLVPNVDSLSGDIRLLREDHDDLEDNHQTLFQFVTDIEDSMVNKIDFPTSQANQGDIFVVNGIDDETHYPNGIATKSITDLNNDYMMIQGQGYTEYTYGDPTVLSLSNWNEGEELQAAFYYELDTLEYEDYLVQYNGKKQILHRTGSSDNLWKLGSIANGDMCEFHVEPAMGTYFQIPLGVERVSSVFLFPILTGPIVHQINPKYLPGITLPVVNIVNVEALTDEENAALTACKGAPCMLKVDTEAEYIALTLDYMARSNEYYFINGSGFGFKSTDGTTWTVMSNSSDTVVTTAQILNAMEASY